MDCLESLRDSFTTGLWGALAPPYPLEGERMARGIGVMVAVAGVALALAGCDSSTPGTPAPTTAGVAADVPRGFDPCTDIPQSLLEGERLVAKRDANLDGPGGIKWRGCGWVELDGIAPTIRVTNITVDMVRNRPLRDGLEHAGEYQAGDRTAVIVRGTGGDCTINVSMNQGSLEFAILNPSSNKRTGSMDTCELGKSLVAKVVPFIPAGT